MNIFKVKSLAVAAGVLVASLSPAVASAQQYLVTLPVIQNVMTGISSSGSNQVWFRVAGQPTGVPAACVYQSWSLFYIPNDGNMDPNKALSILLSAKMGNQPIQAQINVDTAVSDFFGYGRSQCGILRLVIGN